jgi:hypothetical protein
MTYAESMVVPASACNDALIGAGAGSNSAFVHRVHVG